jgi:hypothetical protein
MEATAAPSTVQTICLAGVNSYLLPAEGGFGLMLSASNGATGDQA